VHADSSRRTNFIRSTDEDNGIGFAGKGRRLEGLFGSECVVGNQKNDEIVTVRVGTVSKYVDAVIGDGSQYSPQCGRSVTNPHSQLHLFLRLCHRTSN
jgi:hypothetical protein